MPLTLEVVCRFDEEVSVHGVVVRSLEQSQQRKHRPSRLQNVELAVLRSKITHKSARTTILSTDARQS